MNPDTYKRFFIFFFLSYPPACQRNDVTHTHTHIKDRVSLRIWVPVSKGEQNGQAELTFWMVHCYSESAAAVCLRVRFFSLRVLFLLSACLRAQAGTHMRQISKVTSKLSECMKSLYFLAIQCSFLFCSRVCEIHNTIWNTFCGHLPELSRSRWPRRAFLLSGMRLFRGIVFPQTQFQCSKHYKEA